MLTEAKNPIIADSQPFDEWFLSAVNGAGLMLMCSIGHRLRLFDAMATLGWTTPDELADRADVHPRYVREWLAAMATGGIVEIDEDDHYRMPQQHAPFLTTGDGSETLPVMAQYIAVLGGVEDEIVERFRHGGGVPYEHFDRFHEVMAEDSGMTVLAALEDKILPLVPGLKEQLEGGIRVLDVGCGRGLAMIQLAEKYPRSEFVGYDLSEEAITFAQQEAASKGLSNVRFRVRDATDFDETAEREAFDLVTTFDAVHDQAKPKAVLRGIARTLKPDGVYLMQDIHAHSHVHGNMEHPMGPILYTVSCMHCMTVSLAQDGEGLGTMWGRETALAYLEEAGFTDVAVHRLEHDIQNDYFVARKNGRA